MFLHRLPRQPLHNVSNSEPARQGCRDAKSRQHDIDHRVNTSSDRAEKRISAEASRTTRLLDNKRVV